VRNPRFTALAVGSVAALLALGTAACQAGPGPPGLAERIESTHAEMLEAIEVWRAEAGDPPAGQAPTQVMAPAQALQEDVRRLAGNSALAQATIPLLPGELRGDVRDLAAAARKLRKLAGGGKAPKLRTGKPEPLASIVSYYREAEGRYGVALHYLAAINLVETRFGRVKSHSVAGARGPMQFIPTTWKIYGLGGNINDPHDAILAAANLLRDNGAPGDYAGALYAYNPSRLYVAAVQRYAGLIAREAHAIHYLYAWGP
jgi:membrane-bound lytic murein transglycosylase B